MPRRPTESGPGDLRLPSGGTHGEGGTNGTKAARRAAALADARRREAGRRRRRRRLQVAGGIVAAVTVVAAALVVVGLTRSPAPSKAGSEAPPTLLAAVAGVPQRTYDTIGVGGATSTLAAVPGSALRADGKPRVLYVGAEYCPYCAAERWAVVGALSRFGTFRHLGQTFSAADDIDPSTATLSFHGATFSSRYLSFTGVETTTNKRSGDGYEPLDTPEPADERLLATYDTTQYTGTDGSIPFIDLGGRLVSAGAGYDPALLAGLDQARIATLMSDPTSKVARAIDGSANLLTAALCRITGDQPASVCHSAGVTTASAKLPAA